MKDFDEPLIFMSYLFTTYESRTHFRDLSKSSLRAFKSIECCGILPNKSKEIFIVKEISLNCLISSFAYRWYVNNS